MAPAVCPSPCPVYASPLNPKRPAKFTRKSTATPHTSETTRRGGSSGEAVLRSWPTTPEIPTSKGRCVSRPMPMGAGFPKPKAMRPSTFGLPLSSSRLMSGVLDGIERLAYRPLQSQLGVAAQLHETLQPDLALDGVTERRDHLAEKGRTVGKSGAKTSNCRPAANLQLSLNNSPYACVSRNPLRSAKTLVLSKNTADILPPERNFPISGPLKRTPISEFRALIAMVCCENPPANFGTRKTGRPGPWGRAVLYMTSSLTAPKIFEFGVDRLRSYLPRGSAASALVVSPTPFAGSDPPGRCGCRRCPTGDELGCRVTPASCSRSTSDAGVLRLARGPAPPRTARKPAARQEIAARARSKFMASGVTG